MANIRPERSYIVARQPLPVAPSEFLRPKAFLFAPFGLSFACGGLATLASHSSSRCEPCARSFSGANCFFLQRFSTKSFYVKSFVLLTMELSVRTLATWPVTRPSSAAPSKFNTAPETFVFLPPERSSPIPAVPSSLNSTTSSAASRRISAGRFPTSASFASPEPNLSRRQIRLWTLRKSSTWHPTPTGLCKPTRRALPPALRCFRSVAVLKPPKAPLSPVALRTPVHIV
jgi:hypothetical protein